MEIKKLINPTSTNSLLSAMEKRSPLAFALFTLSTDTCKIYFKNGWRIMTLIATLTLSLQTMLFLFKSFYIQPSISISLSLRLDSRTWSPYVSFDRYYDMRMLWGVGSAFILTNSIASFVVAITTIQASAFVHATGNTIPIKDLALNIVMRSVKRPLLTCFYIGLLSFSFHFLLGFLPLLPIASILLTVSAFALYTYLSVVWSLAFVVSAMEEKSGLEALGKAAQIVNGNGNGNGLAKLQGLILNVVMIAISLIKWRCVRAIVYMQLSEAMRIVVLLIVENLEWMVKMFGYTTYTLLYFQCKKAHGEEIELLLQAEAEAEAEAAEAETETDHNNTEYSKIPTTPLISDNMP